MTFFPFYLKNSDCIISPFPKSPIPMFLPPPPVIQNPLRFFQALRNGTLSSILPAAMTENLTPGASLPVLTAKLKTSQKPPLKNLLSSAEQSCGNSHSVLERPAGAEAQRPKPREHTHAFNKGLSSATGWLWRSGCRKSGRAAEFPTNCKPGAS